MAATPAATSVIAITVVLYTAYGVWCACVCVCVGALRAHCVRHRLDAPCMPIRRASARRVYTLSRRAQAVQGGARAQRRTARTGRAAQRVPPAAHKHTRARMCARVCVLVRRPAPNHAVPPRQRRFRILARVSCRPPHTACVPNDKHRQRGECASSSSSSSSSARTPPHRCVLLSPPADPAATTVASPSPSACAAPSSDDDEDDGGSGLMSRKSPGAALRISYMV